MNKKQNQTKWFFTLLLLLTAVFCLQSLSVQAEEAADDEKANWTVMIYFCGSDLESLHGMATYNLKEIAGIHPVTTIQEYLNENHGTDYPVWNPYKDNNVNVVFETGVCEK